LILLSFAFNIKISWFLANLTLFFGKEKPYWKLEESKAFLSRWKASLSKRRKYITKDAFQILH